MTGEGFGKNSQPCLVSEYFLFPFPSVQMKVDVTSFWLTFEATSQLHSRTPHLFCDSAPAAVAWPAVLWQKSPRGALTVHARSSWTPWPDSWLRHSWTWQITAAFCELGQKLGKDTTLKRNWCKHIVVSLLAGLSSGPSCLGTFLVFNFCMSHEKFSGIMCIHVCYLIGADSVLTLWFILLHHQCWDSQRRSDCVCCLCLCMTLEACNMQIEWWWDVHWKWVICFVSSFFKLYPLLLK